MLGAWWLTLLLTNGGAVQADQRDAAWPRLELTESLTLEQATDAPPLAHGSLRLDETRGPDRLGVAGLPAHPSADNVAVAGIDLFLGEEIGSAGVGPSLGGLLGCPALAHALATQCIGGTCLGGEDTLTTVCEDVVTGVAVELAGRAFGLVEHGAIFGGPDLSWPRGPVTRTRTRWSRR